MVPAGVDHSRLTARYQRVSYHFGCRRKYLLAWVHATVWPVSPIVTMLGCMKITRDWRPGFDGGQEVHPTCRNASTTKSLVPMSERSADKLPDWDSPPALKHTMQKIERQSILCEIMQVNAACIQEETERRPSTSIQANEQVVRLNKITWSIMAQHIDLTLARFGKSQEWLQYL